MTSTRADFKELTRQSRETVDWIAGFIKPFQWIPRHIVMSATQLNHLAVLRDVVDVNHLAAVRLPEVFWSCLIMPGRCTPPFRSLNDAAALAIALTPTVDAFFDRIAEQEGASDLVIAKTLWGLDDETVTPSGTVFAEHSEEGTSLWFGSKARKLPSLTGFATFNSVRSLFLIPEAKEQRCRVCGCTEENCRQCIEASGQPCHWIETDLCSRCDAEASNESRIQDPGSGERQSEGSDKTQKQKSTKRRIDAAHHMPAAAASSSNGKAGRKTSAAAVPAGQSDSTKLLMVDLDDIQPAANNHRKGFDRQELSELTDSIKQHGVLQPILLRQISISPDGTSRLYEIIAGERRWRAAMNAGLSQIPAQISERAGLQASLAMFEENIRRVDLSPIERAQAIQTLMAEHKLSQKEVGKIIGVQQGQVSNELRLLNLPLVWQERLSAGKVAPTLIRPLLPYCDLPHVLEAIEFNAKEEESLDEPTIKGRLKVAILKHSRPIKYQANWRTFSAPKKEERHFKNCSPENLKALAPRTIDLLHEWEGQERTFNVELFDQLNAEPLATRVKKNNAHKKEVTSRHSSPAGGSKSAMSPFKNELRVKHAIDNEMSVLLAEAIEKSKDKASVAKLCTAYAIAHGGEHSFLFENPDSRNLDELPGQILDLLLKDSSQQFQARLRTAVLNDLRAESSLGMEGWLAFSACLQVNLVDHWKPTNHLLDNLTDAGLANMSELITEDLPNWTREESIVQLAARWPPGLIPDFLRPFFGMPTGKAKAKPSKKKVTAA